MYGPKASETETVSENLKPVKARKPGVKAQILKQDLVSDALSETPLRFSLKRDSETVVGML